MAKPIRELFDLAGKTAIVTGGSRGIGKEMAEGLAEAGASLMLCARRQEWLDAAIAEFTERGFEVCGHLADVSKPDEVQTVVDEAVAKYGRIDILVNNAGVSWGAMPEEMPRRLKFTNVCGGTRTNKNLKPSMGSPTQHPNRYAGGC